MKADATDPIVGIASMVGKYVRELLMSRIVTFYQEKNPELRPASGYHDSVTKAFVDETTQLRRRLQIRESCFRRER